MGGSGGGSSGTIAYPAYIQTFHSRLLDNTGTDAPGFSLIDAMTAAYSNSPFAGAVSFDPSTDIAAALGDLVTFAAAIASLDFITNFIETIDAARDAFPLGTTSLDTETTVVPSAPDVLVVTDAEIDAAVEAMDTILTDQIEQKELPRFRAGMLNINAIHSSAYIIGEALIRASKDTELIKYGTELHIKTSEQVREINSRYVLSYRDIIAKDIISTRDANVKHKIAKKDVDAKFYMQREELVRMASTAMVESLMKKAEFSYQHAHLSSEIHRLAIVSKKEQMDEQLAIDESDGKWDIDLFRHAGILLSAPSGGVAQGNDRKSRAVSAIGGAISGAAAGAAVGAAFGTAAGPGYGTAIGAVVGAGLSLLQ